MTTRLSLRGAWEIAHLVDTTRVCLYEGQPLHERASFQHIWRFVDRATETRLDVHVHCASDAHARRLYVAARQRAGFIITLHGRVVTCRRRIVAKKKSIWAELIECDDKKRFMQLLKKADPKNYKHVRRLSMQDIKELYFAKLYRGRKVTL